MKNTLVLLAIVFSLFSCKTESKDYVTLSGKITNPQSDTLYITLGKNLKKAISVNQDGTFSDTLKVVNGDFRFNYGDDYGIIYLKNDNVTSMTFDHNNFYKTLVYGGDDADINNFAIQNYLLINKHFSPDMAYDVKQEDIDSSIQNLKTDYEKLKSKFDKVDSIHISNNNTIINRAVKSAQSLYTSNMALQSVLPKGTLSPVFENYENYNGGNTSLSDFKGNYVYIIFWASWHKASKKYFPFLEQMELQYKGKNIAFVCISLDDARTSGTMEKAKDVWRKSITYNHFSGIQIISDDGWNSDFVRKYQVKGIPRFVLIDPSGNIVSPAAPSPSNPKLKVLLDSLGI